MRKIRQAYASQKCAANKRGIEFLLSFEEWYHIWQVSGKWDERGRGSEKYCMARHNDIGPYSINNVSIITNHENLSLGNKDRWKGKIVSDETKDKLKQARKLQVNVGYDKTIYTCVHCDKQVRSKSNLVQHTRASHA
jgi:hypothetical protein